MLLNTRRGAALAVVMTTCSCAALLAQNVRCPERGRDPVVRRVQQSSAFALAVHLAQREYVGGAALPARWLHTVCSGMVSSIPRTVTRLMVVRAELATELVAVRATFAVRADSVFLLNKVASDSTLDLTIDLEVWNRAFGPAMPAEPPSSDLSSALEYACLFAAIDARAATMSVGGGQCEGRSYSLQALPGGGVSIAGGGTQIRLSNRWEVEVSRPH